MSLELSVASDPEMLLLKDSPLQNKSLYSFFFKQMDEIAQKLTTPGFTDLHGVHDSLQLLLSELPVCVGSSVTLVKACPSWARDVKQQSSANEKKIDSY